jgi:hypothetical protein
VKVSGRNNRRERRENGKEEREMENAGEEKTHRDEAEIRNASWWSGEIFVINWSWVCRHVLHMYRELKGKKNRIMRKRFRMRDERW